MGLQMTEFKRIPLVDRHGRTVAYALVDPDMAEQILAWRWHRDSHGYARAYTPDHHVVFMHRLVIGLTDASAFCDHINRDPLDNRRENLRVVTPAQNMQNRKAHRGARSRFRGVYWKGGRHRKWAAQGRLDGQKHHIGYFDEEIDAAVAAEAWRREHMPFSEPDEALRVAPAA